LDMSFYILLDGYSSYIYLERNNYETNIQK